jgi:hypothetical protein
MAGALLTECPCFLLRAASVPLHLRDFRGYFFLPRGVRRRWSARKLHFTPAALF